MIPRFASKTSIISFSVVLTFVFTSVLLLATVGVAGQGKYKEKICHITGTYDFGEGDVPIGQVITIAEPASKAHINHGDPEAWKEVTLPDGSKACVEAEEVICHITGTYDFGDGNGEVPIGHVISMPISAHHDHLNHGDPEAWKEVTLPDGSKACVESVVTAQVEEGYAFMGHDAESSKIFTKHLTPYMGATLFRHWDDSIHTSYPSLTTFHIDGKQYLMGHYDWSDSAWSMKFRWFIQRILPTGELGKITDSGHFGHHYKTLIALERPAQYGGKVYIFGQRDYDDNGAFTMRVLPGGKLSGTIAWSDTWANYYDAVTPLPNNYHTCFFMQDTHDKKWYIECIRDDGSLWDHDSGTWSNGWQTVVSYRTPTGWSYLFGHRHRYSWGHYYGPWFIQHITDNSTMGGEYDRGEWHNYYKTMTVFKYPSDPYKNWFFLIGHNTDKHWFIQHVTYAGTMGGEIDHGGPWDHYYEHFFPIEYDEVYLHAHNWMYHLNDIIGSRKLSQMALPGSHDAGMNEADRNTCYMASSCNTVTQSGDIGYQLQNGSRYFDIRPMVPGKEADYDGREWCSGHGDSVGSYDIYGCQGECKSSIIDNLKAFFDDPDHQKELVILKFSHCMKKPGTHFDGRDCSNNQINNMMENLSALLWPYLVKGDIDLTGMTLNEILDYGNIIILDTVADRKPGWGIFRWGTDLKYYDHYSNTHNFDVMVNGGVNNEGKEDDGQIAKLLNEDNHSWPFLLSWTLTLNTAGAIGCPGGFSPSIMEMAAVATPQIDDYMVQLVEDRGLTKTLFPNILYVDAFSRTPTNTAIYLNRQYDTLGDNN